MKKIHAYEVHAREMHVYEVHTHEMCACEVNAHEVHAHEGFYEYLARQNTVAHLFQLQLGFLCCRIWVSVIRGVLKTTI